MLFKFISERVSTAIPKHFRQLLLPLNLGRTIKFSSLTASSNWVHDNQLFRRHPRLRVLEEQCTTFHHFKQALSYIIVSGLHRNPFVMSRVLYLSLFEMEGDIKRKSEFGVQIFNQFERPNIFSWNTVIRYLAACNDSQNSVTALNFYLNMVRQEVFPDNYTFPFLLQACGAISDLGLVKQIHSHVLKLQHGCNLFVQNSLLGAYLICGSSVDAWLLFDEMLEKDVVSWTTLISGLVEQFNYREALQVFREMIDGNCQTRPTVATMISAVSACGNLGSLDHTKCFHTLLEKAGWLELDVAIANSLINAYAKSGSMKCSTKVFDDIHDSKRDVYSWTAVISGYAMHGEGVDALNMFSQMEQVHGLIPDAITFIATLSACVHSGQVEEGLRIFKHMNTKYGIEPNLKHYGCIVDLLGRAGMLKRAYSIVQKMPQEPNLAILGSLLNACRLHNNVELGETILKKIELVTERSGGAPVLLSNMYAKENQWSKVSHIRVEMRGVMQEKPPGRSWIQVKVAVHEFVAADKSHPQAMELDMVLQGLESLTKM
ncbi:Pentatricopeptide repeat-containing protein [Abeliophyllum distichum]|uniref:Pentatricopeptide repeat-containing protein n=1 Tax=Abeliophyllum distichum TaxID=126358 RepID=A0ABD1SE31_9LAMI